MKVVNVYGLTWLLFCPDTTCELWVTVPNGCLNGNEPVWIPTESWVNIDHVETIDYALTYSLFKIKKILDLEGHIWDKSSNWQPLHLGMSY